MLYLLSGLSLSLKHQVNTITSQRSLTEQAFDRIPFGYLFPFSRCHESAHQITHTRTHVSDIFSLAKVVLEFLYLKVVLKFLYLEIVLE